MISLSVLFLFRIVVSFTLADDEEPSAVFVFIRSASMKLPLQHMSDQSNRIFFRGRDQLSEEAARVAYLQGKEFHRRHTKRGVIDSRYIPKQVRIRSSQSFTDFSTGLYFGVGLFGYTHDRIPIIPIVEMDEKIPTNGGVSHAYFMNQIYQENSTSSFTSSLIEAAVVESENPEFKFSPKLRSCLKTAGRRAYFKAQLQYIASQFDFIASLINNASAKVRECSENATKCGEKDKLEAIVMEGTSLIAFSHALSALEEWNELPPAPCSSFIVEVKNKQQRIEVYFKRDHTSNFEKIRVYTRKEWESLKDINNGDRTRGETVSRIRKDSRIGKPFIDENLLERIGMMFIAILIIALYIIL
ncbi:hypothetical protein PRIPAC_96573 [Pristionchus pacificus]|uniref:Uncharacterized protein n=1 Tax=Pristionchus pacificus TaxID=54126 RepID=A0A2A6BD67_PRIPA|nr:hypothetical protein PRIPAC_96573 [Pristionchus pacificus]|eukprot:PDM63781.1 hypothetical protein PRIPAC_49754 [Pristionchus pacificus]